MRISDWSSDVCSSDLPKAKPVVSALGLPLSADEWLAQRGQELDRRLKKFAQHLKRDALDDVRFRDDRLQISPVRTITTPDAEELPHRLDAMMPRIRIPELLHEVEIGRTHVVTPVPNPHLVCRPLLEK